MIRKVAASGEIATVDMYFLNGSVGINPSKFREFLVNLRHVNHPIHHLANPALVFRDACPKRREANGIQHYMEIIVYMVELIPRDSFLRMNPTKIELISGGDIFLNIYFTGFPIGYTQNRARYPAYPVSGNNSEKN